MGKITRIAPLPDAQSMFMNPDLKVYNTNVEIEGGSEVLKSGMNCEAEIIIEQHQDALFVPIQCVVRISGKPVAYVKKGEDLERREVTIGMDNNRMVHILGGLTEGEEVLITPPLQDAVSARSTDEIADVAIPTREQAEAEEASRNAANNRRRNGDSQLSAEDREKLRERLAAMTEDERAEFAKRMRAQRQEGENNDAPADTATPRRRRPEGEAAGTDGDQPRRQRPEGGQRRQRQNQDGAAPAANAQP